MDSTSSWNTGPSRQAIVDFVARVTDPSSSDYVSPEERVAVFDNDGTLWCERPYVQGGFILQRLAEMAKDDESLRTTQPWKAAYEKDSSWLVDVVNKHYDGHDRGAKVLMGGVLKAFGDMTVEEFAAKALEFFKTARHPTYDCSYLDVAYVPMVELLRYLENNGFTTYIVSGGGRDFMRPITEPVYGIPPERVVGSATKLSFKADDKGARIVRQAEVGIVDDGPAKAVNIWDRIGRRPILAAGNANGDIAMLQLTESTDHLSLCMLVSHDDGDREAAYTAGAEKATKLAKQQGWTVISMKDDWRQVFSFQAP